MDCCQQASIAEHVLHHATHRPAGQCSITVPRIATVLTRIGSHLETMIVPQVVCQTSSLVWSPNARSTTSTHCHTGNQQLISHVLRRALGVVLLDLNPDFDERLHAGS